MIASGSPLMVATVLGSGKHMSFWFPATMNIEVKRRLPQLGKILSQHQGFKCTVLFAINPETGEIDPENIENIPNLDALKTADLVIFGLRFRNLPDEEMDKILAYAEAGKPMIALRTSTHPFDIPQGRKYHKYSWNYLKKEGETGDAEFEGGFGQKVFGETWVAHHGNHKFESTRGIVADADHPITRGISDGDIWGPTDVYAVTLPLRGDGHAVIRGQILAGMSSDDPPVTDDRNNPMMPIAWTRTYNGGRVFVTTMGSADDLPSEGVRRMIVNASYWCLGMEDSIDPESSVEIVGEYKPTRYGFGEFIPGKKPSDYDLQPALAN